VVHVIVKDNGRYCLATS